MPSAAAAKLEKQASTEAFDPIRQIIVIIEHKIRNLEKRKRKIESYKELKENGKDLNSDQQAAVSKYEEVQQTLTFANELNKQFNSIAVDAGRQQKKQARKDALERAQQEMAKVKEILMVQDVLQNMGQENVREDFLAGRNGAAQLMEEDLKYLDDLYSEVSPKHGEASSTFQDQLQHSAEHLLNIVDGKSKEIVGTTYAKLKELVTTIQSCGYFDQVAETGEEPVEEQLSAEAEVEVNTHEAVVVIEEEVVQQQQLQQQQQQQQYVTEAKPVQSTDTFPQVITAVSQATPTLPVASPMVAVSSAPIPTPVAAVESSYFSTAAPTFVPAQAPSLQQSRPLNEVIGSVNSSFNFLQESELDSPDLSSILTGSGQQNQQPTPPPSGPVTVAPIPTQTFTNQNFATVPTTNVQQQVVYQAGTELTQPHIPGFATATPNPPPPIPMPPSHHPHRSVSPSAYSNQSSSQQQTTYTAPTQQAQPSSYTTQQQPQEQTEREQVTEQIEVPTDDWGQTDNSPVDWSQQTESQTDWSQHTEPATDWGSSTGNQNDSFITQSNTRVYGSGRGRINRSGGRGSSNGYSGNRGRGNYQNGRGGGGYGYRNNENANNNYYQNGYQQRESFGNNNFGGGFKRGGRGGGSGTGGSVRGNNDRGGPRGGSGNRGGNNSRGNRSGGYVRGGNNKQ